MIRYNRTRAPLVAAVLAAGALAACSDDPTGSVPRSAPTLAQQVAALGFRPDMIEDHGDFVLVEGDVYLSKAQLRTVPVVDGGDPLRPSFQFRTNNLVSSANVRDITVSVAGLSTLPAWQTAVRQALTHWSGISNSYVRMVEGTTGVDITFNTQCVSSNVAAFASWPANGNPGATVTVNTCFGWTLNDAQRLHNMVHELGHTLGFRHSNFAQLGETAGTDGAVHVPNTPTGNDAGSVMNGGTALNSWAGFSAADQMATRTLYPLPRPVASVTSSGGKPLIAWGAVAGATSYSVMHRVSWSWTDWETHEYDQSASEYPLGSTSSLSWLDTGRTYTGQSQCFWGSGSIEGQDTYDYYVTAHFANGTSTVVVAAPVGPC